jgi:hypothetical protein
MKKNILVILVMITALGCLSSGTFPHSTDTRVDLTKKNFTIVRANAVGYSRGFYFLGFIPIVSPSYANAMTDLYQKANISEGKAQALIHVSQERSTLYLILFSIPRLTVRADVIEFYE